MTTCSRFSILFAEIVAVAAPVMARADHDAPADDDIRLEVTVGGETLTGRGVSSDGVHVDALAEKVFGDGHLRPLLAVGAMLGNGVMHVSDPRALDGTVALDITTLGPEARVGLRFLNGGYIDNRIYASLALTRVFKDRRLEIEPVGGIRASSSYGVRLALGASWFDTLLRGHYKSWDALAVLLPGQGELVWERGVGSDRVGVLAGWGI